MESSWTPCLEECVIVCVFLYVCICETPKTVAKQSEIEADAPSAFG